MRPSIAKLRALTYEAFRPPSAQTVSQWADTYRVLVSGSSAEPGQWRTARAPYQREIMDAFTQDDVHEIVMMSSSQVGKSEIELNMMGRAIDLDPGPILYVQPTTHQAEEYSKRRIAPMIAACPTLRDKVYAPKGRDAANSIALKNFPGGSLAIIGANSPGELASKPVRYVFFDEIDRFPASAGTEGDPLELAERRTETFRYNRKIVKTSTPTIKGVSKIERAYNMGTQEEWHTQCPACGEYSFIRFSDIKFDHEKYRSPEGSDIFEVSNLRWRCPFCKNEFPEYAVKRMPAKWVVCNEKALGNGVRSFRLNAFMSPWADWRDIALKFLQAGKDPELLKVFHNTMLGETWEYKDHSGAPEKLYARREHYTSEIPDGVLVLTMGIDTQDNRLEYEVVGWDRNEESWGIEKGIIPGRADSEGVWGEVDALLDRQWEMRNGFKMRILATFIDSGGHFTQEVYRACAARSTRRIWPIKGEGGENKPYVRVMKGGRNGSDSAVRFIIGVDCGKEAIAYAAGIEEPGPRYMHYPVNPDSGYDMEYFRGLFSERMVLHRKGGQSVLAWEKTYERNEPFDCRNYARAAYKYFHWDFAKIEAALNGETPRFRPSEARDSGRRTRRISSGIKI